jgi:Holliday junction resolvase
LSQYRKGADHERAEKQRLEADGWYVIRSAGSKGPVDLVAYKPGQPALFIQCTISKKSAATERALIDLAEDFAGSGPPSPVIAERGKPFRFLREEREAA